MTNKKKKKLEIMQIWLNCQTRRTTRKYKDVEARAAWACAFKRLQISFVSKLPWWQSSWKSFCIRFFDNTFTTLSIYTEYSHVFILSLLSIQLDFCQAAADWKRLGKSVWHSVYFLWTSIMCSWHTVLEGAKTNKLISPYSSARSSILTLYSIV